MISPDQNIPTGAIAEDPATFGLLAEFPTASGLLAAAARVRDAGYTRWDVHSPFPVHGMDKAMGIRKTRLPWFVFLCGVMGVGSGLLLQWWCNAHDYPYFVSGKPYFSIPANIPITFELGVLFAALGTVVGLFVLNRLPELYHPVFKRQRFARVSTDGFFIVIEATDPKFDSRKTADLLTSAGATAVEAMEA
jgi:hypothetical protein